MKVNNNWNDVMYLVDVLFTIGYTVTMVNTKRWTIEDNDISSYSELPEYYDECRGSNYDLSNLDCAITIINRFLKWSTTNVTIFTNRLTGKETNFQELIKPFCNESN